MRPTVTVHDDFGRPIALEPLPGRVVSLVPSLTELVCTLGCANKLIGVTRYCVEPRQIVRQLPKVGGTKNVDLTAILRLFPDLVLANAEENRREDVEQLVASGIRVFVTYPRTVAQVEQLVASLGTILAVPHVAARLRRAIERARGLRLRAAQRRVRVFCPIWKNPWMSFNHDTYASDLVSLCGGINTCANLPARYPEVDLAAVAATDPEVVLLPNEPFRFERKHLVALAPLANTTAVRCGRVYFIDGKALTWFGARTLNALPYLATILGG